MTPSCLVLGNKQALDRLAPVLDIVFDALNLERMPNPSPAEMASDATAALRADVVIAEVSKVSPSISFTLGVAVSSRLPIVYLAAAGSETLAIFSPVLFYDAGAPPARTAFLVAKEVELALGPHAHALGERDDWVPAYVVGERFEGVVAHVDREGGFALVGLPGRPAAMLHVSRMLPESAVQLRNGLVRPGFVVEVEVAAIDRRRRQVQLTEIFFREHGALPRDLRAQRQAELLANCAAIEAMLDDSVGAAFLEQMRESMAFVRQVRNAVAHGEEVPDAALKDAVDVASYIARSLAADSM